jgi:dienelactone hydrolase
VDAPDHGERLHARIDHILQPDYQPCYPIETGFDVYSLMLDHIVVMTAEIDGLVDALSADPRLDMGRAGITGLSFGGMVAFQVAATSQRIQAAVPMISMPTSLERWEDLLTEASSCSQWARGMAAAQNEAEKRASWLRQHEALLRLKNFAPRPLLILCGDQDTDMPKTYAVRAVRELQSVYREYPERLKLTINDGVAHRVTVQMMEDMVSWFQKYL